MSDFDEFLKALAESGGGKKSDEDPLIQASHPVVIELLQKMFEERSANREVAVMQAGGDEEAAKDIQNPQGVQCGLVDAVIAVYASSPFAMMSLLLDKMRGQYISPATGDPGRFLHELGHLLFDLGQSFERMRVLEQMQASGPVAGTKTPKGSWEADEPDEEETEADKPDSPYAGFLTTLNFGGDGDDDK